MGRLCRNSTLEVEPTCTCIVQSFSTAEGEPTILTVLLWNPSTGRDFVVLEFDHWLCTSRFRVRPTAVSSGLKDLRLATALVGFSGNPCCGLTSFRGRSRTSRWSSALVEPLSYTLSGKMAFHFDAMVCNWEGPNWVRSTSHVTACHKHVQKAKLWVLHRSWVIRTLFGKSLGFTG
jgi:hypothetical protein